MNARRIGTRVHYLSVPEYPHCQQRCGWKPERWPHARLGHQTVSLPLSTLTVLEIAPIINAMAAVLMSQPNGTRTARRS